MAMKRLVLIVALALLLLSVRSAEGSYSGIYWTTAYGGDKSVHRADVDGANKQKLFAASSYSGPTGIAVDSQTGEIYWAENDRINKAQNDGSGVTTLIETHEQNFWSIALDGGFVYYNSTKGHSSGSQGIGKVATDGTALQTLNANDGGEGLAFGSTQQQVYYSSLLNSDFWRVDAGGSSPQKVYDRSNDHARIPLVLDELNGYLYFGYNADIRCIDLSAGGSYTTVASVSGTVYGLDLDPVSNTLYYGTRAKYGVIGSIDLDSGANEVLVSSIPYLYGIDVVNPSPTPVPGALLLVGLGTGLVGWLRRSRVV